MWHVDVNYSIQRFSSQWYERIELVVRQKSHLIWLNVFFGRISLSLSVPLKTLRLSTRFPRGLRLFFLASMSSDVTSEVTSLTLFPQL